MPEFVDEYGEALSRHVENHIKKGTAKNISRTRFEELFLTVLHAASLPLRYKITWTDAILRTNELDNVWWGIKSRFELPDSALQRYTTDEAYLHGVVATPEPSEKEYSPSVATEDAVVYSIETSSSDNEELPANSRARSSPMRPRYVASPIRRRVNPHDFDPPKPEPVPSDDSSSSNAEDRDPTWGSSTRKAAGAKRGKKAKTATKPAKPKSSSAKKPLRAVKNGGVVKKSGSAARSKDKGATKSRRAGPAAKRVVSVSTERGSDDVTSPPALSSVEEEEGTPCPAPVKLDTGGPLGLKGLSTGRRAAGGMQGGNPAGMLGFSGRMETPEEEGGEER